MPDKLVNDVTYMGAGMAALIAVGMYLRKIWGNVSGETSVLDSMRSEIERLAQTNVKLSNALGDLQIEIINLRNENITLMGEIGALRNENAALTSEVLKLNEHINKLSGTARKK